MADNKSGSEAKIVGKIHHYGDEKYITFLQQKIEFKD